MAAEDWISIEDWCPGRDPDDDELVEDIGWSPGFDWDDGEAVP